METSHPIMTHEDEIRMKKLNELIDNLLRMRTDSQAIVDFSQKHFELLEENESLKAINNQLLEALKNYTNEVNHGDLDKARELYHGLEFILSQHIEQAGL